jgi:hypothetical protein
MAKYPKGEVEYAKTYLKKLFAGRNKTLYTNVVRVSSSGMSRTIQVFFITKNQPVNISAYVAKILGVSIDRDHLALKMSGAGMDMGFATVYELSRSLYGDGYKLQHRSL